MWHPGNFVTVSVFYLCCDYSYSMLLQCKDEKMVKQFNYRWQKRKCMPTQEVRSHLVWTIDSKKAQCAIMAYCSPA